MEAFAILPKAAESFKYGYCIYANASVFYIVLLHCNSYYWRHRSVLAIFSSRGKGITFSRVIPVVKVTELKTPQFKAWQKNLNCAMVTLNLALHSVTGAQ